MTDSRLKELVVGNYFYTYILIGSSGRYYTGLTQDISKRLAQHNAGRSKSTRMMLPVKLIYLKVTEDRKSARILEVKIKNRTAARYIFDRLYKVNEVDLKEWIDKDGYKKSRVTMF